MGIIDPELEKILKSEKYDSIPVKIALDPRYHPVDIEVSLKPHKPVTQKRPFSRSGLQMLTERLAAENKEPFCFKETKNPNFQDYVLVFDLTSEEIRTLAKEPYVHTVYHEFPRI
jgi:hypothetical protein